MLAQLLLLQWASILRIPSNQLALKYGKNSVMQFLHFDAIEKIE